MACQRNANKVSKLCAVRSGISTTGSKAAAIASSITRGLETCNNTVGRLAAPFNNRLLATIDRPATRLAQVAPLVAAVGLSAYIGPQSDVRFRGPKDGFMPTAAVAVGVRQPADIANRLSKMQCLFRYLRWRGRLAGVVSAASHRLAGLALSHLEPEQQLTQRRTLRFAGRQSLTVNFSASPLTGLLNRQDRLVSGDSVLSSRGTVVQLAANDPGGRTALWHWGTTVVKSTAGMQTITHVQAIQLPSTSYYFDRELTSVQTAGLVSGQLKPETLPGYAGTVSAAEKLAPLWARSKRSLILHRLHWPSPAPAAWQPAKE